MSSENWFIESLMKGLLHDYRIPKVQCERTVETILAIFIEDLLNGLLKETDISLVSSEFPFKQETNHSNNADYVLINKNTLFIVELKTASTSYSDSQLNTYLEIKKEIESKKDASFLIENIQNIKNKSNEPQKYNYLLSKIEEKTSAEYSFKSIDSVKIVYIGPNKLRKVFEKNVDVNFFSFSDLKCNISKNPEYAEKHSAWNKVYPELCKIDILDINKSISDDELNLARDKKLKDIHFYKSIYEQIKCNIPDYSNTIKEVRISKKAKSKPNYQIYFKNNEKEAYYYSGSKYSSTFNENKLRDPISIETLTSIFK